MSLTCRRKFELFSRKLCKNTENIKKSLSQEEADDFLQIVIGKCIVRSIFESLISELMIMEELSGDDFLSGIFDGVVGINTIEELWSTLYTKYTYQKTIHCNKENKHGKEDKFERPQQYVSLISNNYVKSGLTENKLKNDMKNKRFIINNSKYKNKIKEQQSINITSENKDEESSLLMHLVSSVSNENTSDFTESNVSECFEKIKCVSFDKSVTKLCSKMKKAQEMKETELLEQEIVEGISENIENMVKTNDILPKDRGCERIQVKVHCVDTLKSAEMRTGFRATESKIFAFERNEFEQNKIKFETKKKKRPQEMFLISSNISERKCLESKNSDDANKVYNSNNGEIKNTFSSEKSNNILKHDGILNDKEINDNEAENVFLEKYFNKSKDGDDGDKNVNLEKTLWQSEYDIIGKCSPNNKKDLSKNMERYTKVESGGNGIITDRNFKVVEATKKSSPIKIKDASVIYKVVEADTFNCTYGIHKSYSEAFEEDILQCKLSQNLSKENQCLSKHVLNGTVNLRFSCEERQLLNVQEFKPGGMTKINDEERKLNNSLRKSKSAVIDAYTLISEESLNESIELTSAIKTVGILQSYMVKSGALVTQLGHMSISNSEFKRLNEEEFKLYLLSNDCESEPKINSCQNFLSNLIKNCKPYFRNSEIERLVEIVVVKDILYNMLQCATDHLSFAKTLSVEKKCEDESQKIEKESKKVFINWKISKSFKLFFIRSSKCFFFLSTLCVIIYFYTFISKSWNLASKTFI